MRRNKVEVYLHLVWATWDRAPLILPGVERRLLRNIEAEALKQGCLVLAINGMEDHVHLVVSMPTTLPIAQLAKQVKGVSSHFMNETLSPDTEFKWQGSYGVFSVSREDVGRVVAYVRDQKAHHEAADVVPEWEETFETVELPDSQTLQGTPATQ